MTRNAQLGAPGPRAPEKGRAPFGLPQVPPEAGSPSFRSAAPQIPRLRPAPRLRCSAPSARPGPAVAAAECHGAIALLPPLCTMSERRSASSPMGQRPRPSAGRRESEGRPALGRGPRGGGEEEGRWPGEGVGGEGSRTAAAAASSPRPPQLFVQPREVPAPGPSVLPRTPQERTRRGVRDRLPQAARSSPHGSKLSGAASPTAIFPGKLPRRRLRRRFLQLLPLLHYLSLSLRSPHRLPSTPSPPPKLPTAPGPRAAA